MKSSDSIGPSKSSFNQGRAYAARMMVRRLSSSLASLQQGPSGPKSRFDTKFVLIQTVQDMAGITLEEAAKIVEENANG